MPPKSRISSTFCPPAVHLKLDNHRRRWKNTHELIVLPAFRRVLPAKRFGWRQQELKTLFAKSRAASMPSGLLLGERYPSEPWPWVFGFRMFDPDQ
jgi:hypothetical protein